ncbi:hypothetical protein SAMN05421812_10783 [Asanoa hainanensis]|uniref:Uncharacterized protein n=1 Tax=Asanoa hainanensis TaxID=560556 RepID=A0A239N005_9ACTN|nr:hypothetical protein [Asanoa hainanensis]SNT48301.1 hypothetical protein SAMN05421812_10783 [Asanoa hainanensis]
MSTAVIDADVVLDDVLRASEHWRLAGRPTSDDHQLRSVVEGALAGDVDPDDPQRTRFCMVTKGPHLLGPVSLACVEARLRAFGVTVHGRYEISGRGADVAAALYPRATRYFRHGPTLPALWDRLAHRFDTDEFAEIFGVRYDTSLVVPAAQAIADNGLRADDFVALWELGRAPITRADLTERYGVAAANFVLPSEDRYEWFRGDLPLGISRVASGMTAFAMRDERLYDGSPVIVVNGHVPGLSALFEPAAWLFELGIDGDNTRIADVRRMLAGEDSVPAKCAQGSLRRDGVDGNLPLASRSIVNSRHNLVHCSDGLVAALSELRAIRPGPAGSDRLTVELAEAGLTQSEITTLVAADPHVVADQSTGHLSDVTAGLSLRDTVDIVLRLVPPVFGATNGYADGVDLPMLDAAFTDGPPSARPGPPVDIAAPAEADVAAGRAALVAGTVGMLTPAGGTGGRFGGYHLPEIDPNRQKVLARLFRVEARSLSALDIRLANSRFLGAENGHRPPLAVLGSETSAAGLRDWRDGLDQADRVAVDLFWQHGIYRLDRTLAEAAPGRSWTNAILRDRAGRPSRKPHGSMGLFSALLISDLFERWERVGVEYLAVANAYDVLFRVDPAVVGYLANRPATDAVIVTMPWAWSATLPRPDGHLAVRGDDEGWLMDEHGRVLSDTVPHDARHYDVGGAVTTHDGRLWIGERERPAGSRYNTNQLYVRVSALRRLIDSTGTGDRVQAVRRLIAGLPARLEDKTVVVDGVPRQARQLSQPLHGLLTLMSRCAVVRSTRIGPGRGGYAPLKQPADVRFAQLELDRRQAEGDALSLPGR